MLGCLISILVTVLLWVRNRVDSLFTRYFENNLKNVSHYLLEGVRRFALSKAADNFIITSPRPIMQRILPTLGFQRVSIPTTLIGSSIAPTRSTICSNCYKLTDMDRILADDILFELYDDKIIMSNFNEIQIKLLDQQFIRAQVEPAYKRYLTNPNNVIMSFYDNSNNVYLAEVKYNRNTNTIDHPD